MTDQGCHQSPARWANELTRVSERSGSIAKAHPSFGHSSQRLGPYRSLQNWQLKFPTSWLALMAPEGTRQAASRQWFFRAIGSTGYANDLQTMLADARAVWLLRVSTALYSDVRPFPQEGAHALYCRPGQESAAADVIGPRRTPPTTPILLSGYGIKVPPKHSLRPTDRSCSQPPAEKALLLQ